MGARFLCAVLAVAGACGPARGDDAQDAAPIVIFETSQSARFWWTELAYFDDRPKAWDAIVSPEFSASLRVLAGAYEAKVEVGALADRFAYFETFDADSLRAAVQIGWSPGDWSYVLEWEGFDVFEPGIGDFYVGFNTYDAGVSRRFAAAIVDGLPDGLFQASLTAGYVASTFDPLEHNFAELELEWVQPLGGGLIISVAPKLEFADYPHFATTKRQDAILSLKLAPTYNFAQGMTLSLEGQASLALSTLGTKSGETWSITPILSFQTEL